MVGCLGFQSLTERSRTFRTVMESDADAAAMKYDGVRPETLVVIVES